METARNLDMDNYEKRVLAMREERRIEQKQLERLKLRLIRKMQSKNTEKNAGNAA
jgi:hypothetical protein